MKIERFEDLEIWRESRELCKQVYVLTSTGGFARDFKLRDQIHSSSGSIMDCIAEGFERDGNKEFIQFLSIATVGAVIVSFFLPVASGSVKGKHV